MIFDTDVLIWARNGHEKAADLIDDTEDRYLTSISYMELLQGAKNKRQQINTRKFINEFDFKVIPVNETINNRALVYIEEYALSHSMHTLDALIAATAVEKNIPLRTANYRHYIFIKELVVKKFLV